MGEEKLAAWKKKVGEEKAKARGTLEEVGDEGRLSLLVGSIFML